MAAAALLCGCTEKPEPPVDPIEAVGTCPTGDRAWRAVLEAKPDPADLPESAWLAGQVERCAPRWEPLWFKGEVELRRGELQEAQQSFQQGAAAAEQQADPTGIACNLNRLGVFAYYNQELERSETLYRQALAAARQAERRDLEGFALNNLAGTQLELNRIGDALSTMSAASETLKDAGRGSVARSIAYNLAVLSMELGDWNGVREELERLDEACAEAGDLEVGPYVRIALGFQALARGELEQAAQRYRSLPSSTPVIAAERSIGLGRVAMERGELEDAAGLFGTAAAAVREHGLPVESRARVLELTARARQGRSEEARDGFRALIDLKYPDTDSEDYAAWSAWQGLGGAEHRLGNLDAAAAAYRRSIDAIERLGTGLDMTGDGLYFLSGRNDPYLDLAWLLAGSPESVSELPEIFAGAQTRALGRIASEPGEARPFDTASLEPNEAWLGYLIGAERSVALVATRDNLRAVRLEGSRKVAGDAQRYLAALRRPGQALAAQSDPMADLNPDLEAGRRVRRAWIDPLLAGLDGIERLWLSPAGDLATLPVAALPLDGNGEGFLADRFSVIRMPRPGTVPRGSQPFERVLLAGDPTRDGRPRLPRAASELRALEQIWGTSRSTALSAAAFVAEPLEGALQAGPNLVHFATHAEASSLDPRKSGLELSADNRLGFDRIGRLPLDEAWVVLGACSTGEGESIPGQGIVGLGWAFLTAGSRGVLMTLWELDDDVAAEFSVALHRELERHGDPVSAVHRAAAEIRENRPHPYFWAPYSLTLRSD
ncbi:hypothetical protein ABI59_11275 [Acidobacteria bacterium Mor1]|nr:hypothetical protein ABI59_11275 [Acidobacteria bacterium Mor1]